MVDIINLSNRVLRSKGNLIRIKFTVNDNKLEAFVPDDQLFGAIKDVLLNREYEYLPDFELVNFKNEIIVDAGAHVGLFSLVASNFAKEVISIEPHPINFNLLIINKIINNVENIIPIDKALWYEKATLNLIEGVHTGSSSVIHRKNNIKCYRVHSCTLKEIIDEYGEIGLFKMDIEGSEFEIFRQVDRDALNNIKCISAEIHTNLGDLNRIVNTLSSQNFRVNLFHPPLIKNSAKYQIKVKNLSSLKVWRKLVYSLSTLARITDKSLAILFAQRK